MIDTLIFDFDGIIIDTETPDYLSWQEVYHSRGVELERSLWSEFIGGGDVFDAHQYLEKLTGNRIDRDALREQRRRRYLEIIEAKPLLPGVMDYILEAKKLGLKLGVASSSSRDWVEGHLAGRDILRHFVSVKSSNDVSNVKPDPELYLISVAQMGTQPENALAIEDSANGVTAAKRAGLYCVAVPNEMTKDMQIDHADLRLESLSEMPLKSLLARLTETGLST
ncbi:MAG: HAD-IA family hydrolase [Chloroflexi bacterium]|nr:HAD-IA family hydrolase [Chloroflexota bacterium]